MPEKIITKIIKNERIANNIYFMALQCETNIKDKVVPGQFANISVPGNELILSRPISINGFDNESNTFEFVYQLVGEGTKRLSVLKEGTSVSILAPLGNGFVKKDEKKILLIGGGVGVAPLKFVAKEYSNIRFDAIIGFKNSGMAYQLDEMKSVTDKLYVCTEDGSIGIKGFVTDALKTIDLSAYDAIYICGPKPMSKAVKNALSEDEQRKTLISMEERMGCGIGGCAVCACKVQLKGRETYLKVCKDGPVFDLSEVIL